MAAELPGLFEWINSKPLTLAELRGKPVFLDFWAYSCVNCRRETPYVKRLHEKYSKNGLVVIGVHVPEFEFEKKFDNVRAAVERAGITYPVALDNTHECWNAFGNKYWPRTALIDKKGNVVFEHAGEGGALAAEPAIAGLLGVAYDGVKHEKPDSHGVSPETYCGFLRSEGFGNGQVCEPYKCGTYRDPGKHQRDSVYLEGEWTQEPEYVYLAGNSGHAAYLFSGREANVVMEPVTDNPCTVTVYMGGEKVRQLAVDHADMYQLVSLQEKGEHELRIVSTRGLGIYAFTFG
ncbi:redoxin family protein [Candidatus Micrarchaeota archaeon]|nr:redoxin family protein [Candidatus Micrarchaeota archaeon]